MVHVHLSTFNHPTPPYTIVDQIRFLKRTFRHIGVAFSWGEGFRSSALNFLLENFKSPEAKIIEQFTFMTGKRVGILVTEHVEYKDNQIYFDTVKIPGPSHASQYMEASVAFERFSCLIEVLECARKFYTLGDHPSLNFLSSLEIPIAGLAIPFPPVRPPVTQDARTNQRAYDLSFTGNRTSFRDAILGQLQRRFKLMILPVAPNERARGELYRNSRIILNVVQSEKWRWTSPMRIFAALDYGRVTVSLFTRPQSEIDQFAYHLPGPAFVDEVGVILGSDLRQIEHDLTTEYNNLAAGTEGTRWAPLRRDLQAWAVEEGLA